MQNHDGEVETLWNGDGITHRFFEAAGLRWHAITAGDPENPAAVVFLHGFPESCIAWHHQVAGLADDFFTIALDLKGHGQSDTRLDSDYDYAAQAAELPAVFDALGLDRFYLVAHDRGAVISDHLCSVPGMSQRIRRYVRMQQSGNRPHSEPRPPHELFRSPMGAAMLAQGDIQRRAFGLEPMPHGLTLIAKPIAPQDIDRIIDETTQPGVPEGMSASFVSAGFDRELEDRMNGLFASMTMPVLFLQGAEDAGQQPHEYETVTDEVANGHLQFLELGHFLHLEDPPVVNAAIREFLARDDLPS